MIERTSRKNLLMFGAKLTAIIQSRRLTLFGHIMRMDDNADAKRILLASPPADWRRQLGHPRITWLSTVQQDLKQHHLMLPKAADLAQNRRQWRMMSTYGATQSWVACQKRRRRWASPGYGFCIIFPHHVPLPGRACYKIYYQFSYSHRPLYKTWWNDPWWQGNESTSFSEQSGRHSDPHQFGMRI